MDRFNTFHQEFQNVQMEVKQVQFVQSNHEDRLQRLERRQNEDAALKSVWNSPFPSMLGGTPQHGPVQMPSAQVFDDFDDEQSQNLLGSLHIDADDEPVRRGAASRANSVRFDEATLQSSNWGGQGTRQSGEFGPARPSSGMGGQNMMERSYSHKSDGRHSSAGHSVHSVHSAASGRASSLGLDNMLLVGREDDSPIDVTEPPPGLLFLGSVPSIVRCWLTTHYTHDTLLYAVVCTGSQKSTVEFSLLKELGLDDDVHRDMNGTLRVNIPVYFAEATVTQPHPRSSSPSRQVPYVRTDFEVVGMDQSESAENKRAIRVFLGSDTLRASSADLLLSQNRMTLSGNGEDRDRLSIPFVRPEDDATFKHITTVNIVAGKPKLNANAPEFVSNDSRTQAAAPLSRAAARVPGSDVEDSDLQSPFSPMTANRPGATAKSAPPSVPSESGSERPPNTTATHLSEGGAKDAAGPAEEKRRETTGIWGSWRQGTSGGGNEGGTRENGLSGYQPAGRGRSMKILKPQKSAASSSGARTASLYEPQPSSRSSGEHRRKSLGASSALDQNGGSSSSPSVRWDAMKRSASGILGGASSGNGGGNASASESSNNNNNNNSKSRTTASRANPVGGASAFSWMNSGGGRPMEPSSNSNKPKTPVTTA